VIEILTTKFRHWAYEQEYRVFPQLEEKDRRGRFFFEFKDGLVLKEVIVGHRSAITRAELTRALGKLAPTI
jgi:hypothetical protein